jgi:hypothetical protein
MCTAWQINFYFLLLVQPIIDHLGLNSGSLLSLSLTGAPLIVSEELL